MAKPGDALALACRGIALWLHSAGQAPGFQRRIKLKSSARPREAGMDRNGILVEPVKLCQAVSSYVKLSIQYDSICLFFDRIPSALGPSARPGRKKA